VDLSTDKKRKSKLITKRANSDKIVPLEVQEASPSVLKKQRKNSLSPEQEEVKSIECFENSSIVSFDSKLPKEIMYVGSPKSSSSYSPPKDLTKKQVNLGN